MLKYDYPDGSHCCRAIHTSHAGFTSEAGKLIARAEKRDRSGMYEFEITGFESLQPGMIYSQRGCAQSAICNSHNQYYVNYWLFLKWRVLNSTLITVTYPAFFMHRFPALPKHWTCSFFGTALS